MKPNSPNFVWLISEDNSKHFLKLFDENGEETPNIAKLAERGIIFERAFSNASACSVARTTLMTGCYAPRIGAQYHRPNKLPHLPNGFSLFPSYLKEVGYFTTNNKKTDYNVIPNGAPGLKDVWNENGNEASWRNRAEGQPFFHMQTFTTTHESRLQFDANEINQVKTRTNPDSVFVAPQHPNTETFRYSYARYHDRIIDVDQQIGKVLKLLAEDDLLEETIIFYFSDHGGVMPGSKGYPMEAGLHVPLVVRVPDKWKDYSLFDPGSRSPSFVSFVDFAPTLLNMAGLDVPTQMDGRPFLGPGISAFEMKWRNETFGYVDRCGEKSDQVRTYRWNDWKYVRNYQGFNFHGLHNNYRYKCAAFREWRQLFFAGKLNDGQSKFFEPRPAEELYNLQSDPYELTNLAERRDHYEVLSRMRLKLTEHVKSNCDLSMYPENYLVENAMNDPVAFGINHRKEIDELVNIADLQFESFERAKPQVLKALRAENKWHRYWGLISASTFGRKDDELVVAAHMILANDEENLNRVRAAEYLGLIGAIDPAKPLLDSLGRAKSGPEATLILNSITLLRDGQQRIEFEFDESHFHFEFKDGNVENRKDYLLR